MQTHKPAPNATSNSNAQATNPTHPEAKYCRGYSTVKVWVPLLLVVSVLAFAAGYFSSMARVSRFAEVATANLVLDTVTQARHDAGLVELLNQGKIDKARELSLARYYTRILTVTSIARKSTSRALHDQAQQTIDQAKAFWKRNPYILPNSADNEQLQLLLKREQMGSD